MPPLPGIIKMNTVASPNPNCGIFNFLTMIYEGHPEYAVLAVKAPIEQVVTTYLDFLADEEETADWQWQQRIAVRPSKQSESLATGIAVVQLLDNNWVILLRSLFDISGKELDALPKEAQMLSDCLETQAITLIEEDTSGAISYELFDHGELIEGFEECDGEVQFESQWRPNLVIPFQTNPDEEEIDIVVDWHEEYDLRDEPRLQFVDALFCQLGIELPACYPIIDTDYQRILAVDPSAEKRILRADWLEEKTQQSFKK